MRKVNLDEKFAAFSSSAPGDMFIVPRALGRL
jgi:hypothetical protein